MKKIAIICALSILAGCTGMGGPAFHGETHANGKLRTDSLKMIQMFFMADDCNKIDSVYSTVTQPPEGELRRQTSKERWDVSGCGIQKSFEMAFSEDGKGGAFFSTKML